MRMFLFCLGGLLVLELWLVGGGVSSDPPVGFSQDHSFNIDGYWYLSDARSDVDGSGSDVVHSYHRPLIRWPAELFYRVGGVNHFSSRALNVLAAIATLALLASWLRRSYGSSVAWVATALLALDPAWIACARSTVVYPWVAFWVLAVIVVGSGRGWVRWGIAATATVVGAFALKSMVAVAAPALLLDAWARARSAGGFRRPVHWVALGLVLAVAVVALGPWSIPTFWRRIGVYTFGAGFHPWTQLLEYPERAGIFTTSPILLVLGFVGLVVATFVGVPRTGVGSIEERRRNRLVLVTAWGLIALFAFSRYTPLRYHLPILPLLAAAAAKPLFALFVEGHWRGVRPRSLRGRAAMVGLAGVGLYAVAMLVSTMAAGPRLGASVAIAVALATLVVGLGIVLTRRSWSIPAPRPLAQWAIVGVVLMLPALPEVGRASAQGGDTFRRATAALRSVVLPSARIVGPYAHVITTETGNSARQMNSLKYGDGQLRRTVDALSATHLATYHPPSPDFVAVFERDGAPLRLLERFQLRDRSVYLYRFLDEPLPTSRFEEGVDALAVEDWKSAEVAFRDVLRSFPRSAPAWCKLGVALRHSGDPAGARAAFTTAVEIDPDRVEAHIELSNLYGQNGYLEEAYLHLEAAALAAPDSEHLQAQLHRLREELGLPSETNP
ncbi:MAG: tetratricopeptide repeat protein [Planctomycetes bacterium]|nr:tetratricopeptide repeat protein [Planctomycetota bacterium]